MCFMDQTFCNSDCVQSDCYRFFGERQKESADNWWSGNNLKGEPPVAFADFSDTCPSYKNANGKEA